MINLTIEEVSPEHVSDGYHTFQDLYDHRHALFVALLNSQAESRRTWRSLKHSDGSPMYPNHFIAGMQLPSGQISYHLPLMYAQYLIDIPELPEAPPWDGHTPEDVVERLLEWYR